jgi:hypothetical protein
VLIIGSIGSYADLQTYEVSADQLTGLYKQKDSGKLIMKIQINQKKTLSDSINPTPIPKKSRLLYWARLGTQGTYGKCVQYTFLKVKRGGTWSDL